MNVILIQENATTLEAEYLARNMPEAAARRLAAEYIWGGLLFEQRTREATYNDEIVYSAVTEDELSVWVVITDVELVNCVELEELLDWKRLKSLGAY